MSQPVTIPEPGIPSTVRGLTRPVQLDTKKKRGVLPLVLTAMRPHQWVKNLFIFTPLLFGRKLLEPLAVGQALLACITFCLMCSGLYLINDIIDAPADREHADKRQRPIASGDLSTTVALGASLALLATAFSIASTLSLSFFLLTAVYFGLTLAYCITFKHAIILDCMIIAAGFVLRVVSGAAAVNVQATHWLIACAFLLALYLAFSKRRQELLMLSTDAPRHRFVLGSYSVDYLERVNNILIATTIVCYALYTVAPETVARFHTDKLIYGSVFVIYGLLRYMSLTRDPRMGGNPSKVLIRDRPILLTVLCWAAYNSLIIYRESLTIFWARIH